MLIRQMIVRVQNDLRTAREAKEKGYTDSFYLAMENAESTLKMVSHIVNREEYKKHMEAEQYYKGKEAQSIERTDIPNSFYSAVVINTVQKLTQVAKHIYYFLLGWYYVCCDIIGKGKL